MIRILVTGSREWPIVRKSEVWIALDNAYRRAINDRGILTFDKVDVTLVSGACPRGVDAIAEAFAVERGWTVERHPAAWDLHQKAAGFIRNQEMADLGADTCVAMPLGRSPGTRDMIRRARAAGIPTIIHEGLANARRPTKAHSGEVPSGVARERAVAADDQHDGDRAVPGDCAGDPCRPDRRPAAAHPTPDVAGAGVDRRPLPGDGAVAGDW